MACPQCTAPLAPGAAGWLRCPGCGYEITEPAGALYAGMVAAYESDPEKFFRGVTERLADLREQEPVWQRRP